MTNEELQARAFEIADESMRSLIECCCARVDEFGVFYVPLNEDGEDAANMGEVESFIVEACDWLTARGLCEVVESPDGPVITLFPGDRHA